MFLIPNIHTYVLPDAHMYALSAHGLTTKACCTSESHFPHTMATTHDIDTQLNTNYKKPLIN